MLGEQGGVPGMVEQAERLVEQGFRQLWASQVFGVDALTALAVIGAAVPDVQLAPPSCRPTRGTRSCSPRRP